MKRGPICQHVIRACHEEALSKWQLKTPIEHHSPEKGPHKNNAIFLSNEVIDSL